jgi:alpha-1,6-mannosyltransferase
VIGALALLLRRRGLPLERALIYSWCPLPVFEFWATGHNDSILLLFLVLALWGAAAGRRGWAVLALSLGAMTKFWPALLLPSLTGWSARRLAAGALALFAVAAVLWLPYHADLTRNAQLTSGFLGGWRNNDSLHTIVAALAPDRFMAKYVTMALVAAAAIVISRLRWTLEARTLTFIVALLAMSANVHPWYLTWVVPLLVFYPIPALLLWTALMPLTYAVRIDWEILGEWNGTTAWRWLVYIPVLVSAAAGWWIRRANR